MLTSQWLICIHRFASLVSFTGFYTEDEPNSLYGCKFSSWLMVNSLIWLFRVLYPSFMFLCTTIASIFAYFKCIDSYSCSRENETLETIPLNNEELSLVKTKFPMKNYQIVALNFTALQYINPQRSPKKTFNLWNLNFFKKSTEQLNYFVQVDQYVYKVANKSASIHTNQILLSSNRLELSFALVFKKIETTMGWNCLSKTLRFLQIRAKHQDYPFFTVFLTIKTSSQNISITLWQISLKLYQQRGGIGAKSSLERFWKNSSQHRELLLQVE